MDATHPFKNYVHTSRSVVHVRMGEYLDEILMRAMLFSMARRFSTGIARVNGFRTFRIQVIPDRAYDARYNWREATPTLWRAFNLTEIIRVRPLVLTISKILSSFLRRHNVRTWIIRCAAVIMERTAANPLLTYTRINNARVGHFFRTVFPRKKKNCFRFFYPPNNSSSFLYGASIFRILYAVCVNHYTPFSTWK